MISRFLNIFGHFRHADYLEEGIRVLDEFLVEVFTQLPENITLFICSDHGNFEDMSIKSHTRNPALCMAKGEKAKFLSGKIKSLDQIKPALLEVIL